MTKTDIESVKSTIAKLITLANNEGATENESRVAMDRAKKLMAKYQLEEAQVLREKIKTGVDVNAIKESAECYFNGRFENWESRLGWKIAKIFECEAVRGLEEYDWDVDDKIRKMHFIGLPNDLSLVMFFFDYCQDEITRHTEAAYGKAGQKVKNDFAVGMVTRIAERLEEFYKRYKEEMASDCTDLVVFKEDAIKTAMKEAFPHRSNIRLSTNYSKEYLKGRAAGEHVHLSSNLRQMQNGG